MSLLEQLDPHLRSSKRLAALGMLAGAREVEFSLIRDHLEVSDSDLSKQLSALADAGYVSITKRGRGSGRRTWLRATAEGRSALGRHQRVLYSLAALPPPPQGPTEINAITLRITDMESTLGFYDSLGLEIEIVFGGNESEFTSLKIGANFINVTTAEGPPETGWGRVILHVPDPDAVWSALTARGYVPETEPADAPWGERYFHVRDPDGHELSFARRLSAGG